MSGLRDVVDSPFDRSVDAVRRPRDHTLTSLADTSFTDRSATDRERALHQRVEEVRNVVSTAEEGLTARERAIHSLTDENRRLRKLLHDAEVEIDRLRAAEKIHERSALDRLKLERASQQAQLDQLLGDRDLAREQLRGLSVRCDQLAEELRAKSRDADEAKGRLKMVEESLIRCQQQNQRRDDMNRKEGTELHDVKLKYDVQLRSLQAKFDSLDHQCDALRRERDALDQQARGAQLELHELRSKRENRVLIDARELHAKAIDCVRLEEEVMAAHLNNTRLLQIMSEFTNLRSVLQYNDVSKEFVYTGYQLSPNDDGVDDGRGAEHHKRTGETGLEHGIVAGRATALTSKNKFLQPHDGLTQGPLKHLRGIVVDENAFLRKHPVDPRGGTQLLALKREADFWIPHAAFIEAQRFRQQHMPQVPAATFYPFFVNINQIWRSRMASRVSAARTASSAKRIKPENDPAHPSPIIDEATLTELEGLRREVRTKVHSKAALQLFAMYEQVTRFAVSRRAEVERQYSELAHTHNVTLASKAPELATMQHHLRSLADTSRSLSTHLRQKLIGSSSDVMRFLSSLDEAASNGVSTGSVSTAVLR